MITIQKAKRIQDELSKKVITKDVLPKDLRKICGVDVSYKNNRAYCSSIILDAKNMQVIETVHSSLKVEYDYIPGLFMLREAKPILKTIKKLKTKFDVLLVDGHGQLHPRRCGLACYIGIMIEKPTIGVAKNLLCGNQRADSKIELDGKVMGQSIKLKNKTIFISIGHMISLKTACKIIKNSILMDKWYPQPLYLADKFSKKLRKSSTNNNISLNHLKR